MNGVHVTSVASMSDRAIHCIRVTTLCGPEMLTSDRLLANNHKPPKGVHSAILGWQDLTAKRVSVENSLPANIHETSKNRRFARFVVSAIA